MAEQVETNGSPPVVDFTELESKITDLVEVLETEQEQKQAEAEKLAKEQEVQAQQDAENQKIVDEQLQADTATTQDFRQNLMSELQEFNENTQDYTAYFEAIIEHQKIEMELYNAVYFAAVIIIVFGCLLPAFWVVRQFKNMMNWFL